jgi:hypothetical protein
MNSKIVFRLFAFIIAVTFLAGSRWREFFPHPSARLICPAQKGYAESL